VIGERSVHPPPHIREAPTNRAHANSLLFRKAAFRDHSVNGCSRSSRALDHAGDANELIFREFHANRSFIGLPAVNIMPLISVAGKHCIKVTAADITSVP